MIPIGAKRTEKLKRRRLLNTDLISIDFPTKLSQDVPQVYILDLNFSICGSQSLLVALLWKTGSPRYLKDVQDAEAIKPRHLAMELAAPTETF